MFSFLIKFQVVVFSDFHFYISELFHFQRCQVGTGEGDLPLQLNFLTSAPPPPHRANFSPVFSL